MVPETLLAAAMLPSLPSSGKKLKGAEVLTLAVAIVNQRQMMAHVFILWMRIDS